MKSIVFSYQHLVCDDRAVELQVTAQVLPAVFIGHYLDDLLAQDEVEILSIADGGEREWELGEEEESILCRQALRIYFEEEKKALMDKQCYLEDHLTEVVGSFRIEAKNKDFLCDHSLFGTA